MLKTAHIHNNAHKIIHITLDILTRFIIFATSMTIIRDIEKDVKRDVLLSDMAMTLYCLYLIIADSSTMWIGFIFGFTPWGIKMLLKASRFFHLCFIHKAMIIHILMVYICIMYHAEIGFGERLGLFRWLMFLTGMSLWTKLGIQQIKVYALWRRLQKK